MNTNWKCFRCKEEFSVDKSCYIGRGARCCGLCYSALTQTHPQVIKDYNPYIPEIEKAKEEEIEAWKRVPCLIKEIDCPCYTCNNRTDDDDY